jgi:hypothetical protein
MTEPEPTFSRRFAHPDRRKVAALVGACLAIVISAAATMGASPAPSSGAAAASPGASSAPEASGKPRDKGSWKGFGGGLPGFGFGRGGDGPVIGRLGGVQITAIDGSSLSLKTVDGWTRTIVVTPSTKITKGTATITVDDLAVGDTIRFRQQPNADGTFTITRIAVVLPSVVGTVTGKTDSTITIQQRDGTSVTIHVDGSTTYRVEGVTGTAALSDVATGMKILASGAKNADGSLDASRVLAGTGRKLRGDHQKNGTEPEASPSPSASSAPG